MVSLKIKNSRGSGNDVLFLVMLQILQRAVVWEGHLPTTHLPIQNLIGNIVIWKQSRRTFLSERGFAVMLFATLNEEQFPVIFTPFD